MRLRIARPTERLDDIARFYEQGLGLARLAVFRDHDGYSGLVFGVPDERAQVEFTTRSGARAPPATEDEHLVVYYDAAGEQERAVERLGQMGWKEVTPRNPWWRSRGNAFRDPDGWEVILVRAAQAP